MEGFIFVLIIWWVISAFAKNAQKQAKAKHPPLTHEAAEATVPAPRVPVMAAPPAEPAPMLPPEAPVRVTPCSPGSALRPKRTTCLPAACTAASTEGEDPCHTLPARRTPPAMTLPRPRRPRMSKRPASPWIFPRQAW